jgi:hypothetical protein
MEKSQSTTITVPSAVETEPLLRAPHGLDEIIALFGNIHEYVGPDGELEARWHADFLERVRLPFSLPLSWDPSRTITQITCHRRMTCVFSSVFSHIQERGLEARITSFGGCFTFRPQRTGSKLSTHSWGIAMDLNSESNPQGSDGDMDSELIDIFRHAGFEWGGNWPGKIRDPMHFQFCTGY